MIYYYIPDNNTPSETQQPQKAGENITPPTEQPSQIPTPRSLVVETPKNINLSVSSGPLNPKANFRGAIRTGLNLKPVIQPIGSLPDVSAVESNVKPEPQQASQPQTAMLGETLDNRLLKNVFKIVCTYEEKDIDVSWLTTESGTKMSTAFLVKVGKENPEFFVVTNCHAVLHGVTDEKNRIQVKMKQDTEQYDFAGQVLMMNKYVDLALIKPSQDLIDNFGQYACPIDLDSLKLGEISLVPLKTKISVYGNPRGDDSVTVTSGKITQIASVPYVLGSIEGIAYTTDTAINEGNSGGPAYVKNSDQLLGIVFEGTGANTSYLIPADILRQNIRRYMSLRGSNNRTGFVSLSHLTPNIAFQPVDDAMRKCRSLNQAFIKNGVLDPSKIDCNKLGVRVIKVPSDSNLRVNDIIVKANGYELHSNGGIVMDSHSITLGSMDILLDEKNNKYKYEVLRPTNAKFTEYEKLTLETLCSKTNYIIPQELYSDVNEFLSIGGVVISPLTLKHVVSDLQSSTITPDEVVATNYGLKVDQGDQVLCVRAVAQNLVNPNSPILHSVVKYINRQPVFNLLDAYYHINGPIEEKGSNFIEIEVADGNICTLDMGTDFNATVKKLAGLYKVPEPGYKISLLDSLSQTCDCAVNHAAFDRSKGVITCANCNAELSLFSFTDGRVSLPQGLAGIKLEAPLGAGAKAAGAAIVAQDMGFETAAPKAAAAASDLVLGVCESAFASLPPAPASGVSVRSASEAAAEKIDIVAPVAPVVLAQRSLIENSIEAALNSVRPSVAPVLCSSVESRRTESFLTPVVDRQSRVVTY